MTVSGLTIRSTDRRPVHRRESQTHKSRSEVCRRRRRPRLERCRTNSWCHRARISTCRVARVRKQSRREMERVNMAPAAYIYQLHKLNSFMQNGLLGSDRYAPAVRAQDWDKQKARSQETTPRFSTRLTDCVGNRMRPPLTSQIASQSRPSSQRSTRQQYSQVGDSDT
jgi:hypothetical protein